jgi:hypothetical protein
MKLVIKKNFILGKTYVFVCRKNIKAGNLLLSLGNTIFHHQSTSSSLLYLSHSNRLPYRSSTCISSLSISLPCPTHDTYCVMLERSLMFLQLCQTINFYNIHYLVFSRYFSGNIHLCSASWYILNFYTVPLIWAKRFYPMNRAKQNKSRYFS